MNPFDIILPVIYFCISLVCFFLGLKGLKTRTLIFKRGTKGTGLESNVSLIRAQIIAAFFLSVVMFVFSVAYTYIIFTKMPGN
jgi:hypothetical protein